MRIGIYGGSFDPLHIGHTAMASYVAQFGGVDQVWLMVSPENPLKRGRRKLTTAFMRLDMAREAIGDDSAIKVSDFEFSMPIPSYTLSTLEALSCRWPEHRFTLIIGADNWEVFNGWKNPREIIEKYGVIIYPRRGFEPSGNLPENVIYLKDAPLIEVSSTFIRNSITKGMDMRYFLPEPVDKYIKSNSLYKTND